MAENRVVGKTKSKWLETKMATDQMWTSGSLASCQCTEMQQHMNPPVEEFYALLSLPRANSFSQLQSTEFLPMMLGKELMRGFWVDPEKYGRAFHLLLVHTVSLFQFHLSISNHAQLLASGLSELCEFAARAACSVWSRAPGWGKP